MMGLVVGRGIAVFTLLILLVSCAPVDSIRKQRYRGPSDTSAAVPQDNEDISKDEWGQKKSQPYTVDGETYYPLEDAAGFMQTGVASWYGPDFHGKNTANGETYNQHAMTAAHKTLPFNTFVRVHNTDNGKTVVVRINDRGPFKKDRIIDLSNKAAAGLGMIGTGTANVKITIMSNDVRDTRRVYIAGKRLPPRAEAME